MLSDDDLFEKQRRNVFITSLLLALITFAGVTIGKEMKAGVITINFATPENIIILVAVMHTYFIVRFFQTIPDDTLGIRNLFYKYRMDYLAKQIYTKVIKHEKEVEKHEYLSNADSYEIEQQKYYEDMFLEFSTHPENVAEDVMMKDLLKIKKVEDIAKDIEYKSKLNYKWQFKHGLGQETALTINFKEADVIISYPYALWFILLSKDFLLYHFPYLFGTAVLLSHILKKLFQTNILS